jgi:tetratricopeptide (TPR) repeat protein/predicted Ser/Thr protein kinase
MGLMGQERPRSERTDVRPSARPPPDPALSPPHGELAAGTRVSRYVVLKHLARGGMGVVYLAYDEELDRRVALKILAPDGSGDASDAAARSARLLREAQAMAKLSHPNVVAVYDVGTFGDQVFLAMEYVDGVDLREWREAKTRTAREIVATYVQAGRGLEAAHAAGILHRDFKPENVVVDAKGRARVLDFGVARVDAEVSLEDLAVATTGVVSSRSSNAQLTQVGALIGTPAYMAPEQLRGDRAEARSDQFAVAVALYEALYGERPFGGKTVRELIDAIVSGALPAPRKATKVRRGVRAALQRALRAKVDDRFPTMGAFLDALELATAKRRGYVIAAGAALLVAAAVAIVLVKGMGAAPSLVCRGGAREIATVWGPSQRDAVVKSFAATGVAFAEDTSRRVVKILDDYASAWKAMRDESCEATRVRGVQSDEALDLRTACLDQRREELAATIRIFTSATPKLVGDAVTAARGLGDIALCADVAALRAPFATPHDPAERARVQAIRKQIAEGTALLHAQRLTEAETAVRPAADDAKSLGNRQLLGQALEVTGHAKFSRGEFGPSRETFLDAALDASVVKDDVTEASAWIALVGIAGYELDDEKQSALYARLAQAALDRIGKNDALRSRLLRNRAHVFLAHMKLDEALALYREALEMRKLASGAESAEAAALEVDIADVAYMRLHLREAIVLYESALAKRAAALGEDNPTLATIEVLLAGCYADEGDPTKAREYAERALRIAGEQKNVRATAFLNRGVALLCANDREGGFAAGRAAIEERRAVFPRGPRLAILEYNWSNAVLRRHYAEDALRELDAAAAALGSAAGHEELAALIQADRALALARVGRGREAVGVGAAAVPIFEARFANPADPRLLEPLLALGEARLAVKDGAGAVGPLERANAIAETAEGFPEWHADTHLALARALVATRGDASRARALAERAAKEYEGARMAEPAKEAGTSRRTRRVTRGTVVRSPSSDAFALRSRFTPRAEPTLARQRRAPRTSDDSPGGTARTAGSPRAGARARARPGADRANRIRRARAEARRASARGRPRGATDRRGRARSRRCRRARTPSRRRAPGSRPVGASRTCRASRC